VNKSVENVLIIAAKNAVNAALTSLTPIFATPQAYNLNTKAGLEHVGLLVAGAVASRELMVWVPKLMAWSTTQSILFGISIYGIFLTLTIHYIK
jgi:hypothetical protein